MDTIATNGFFDELVKISQEFPTQEMLPPAYDNIITKDRLKRFAGGALAGAAGVGVGYGVAKLVGAPLSRKLMQYGLAKAPDKVLRYALPTAAGLSAAYVAMSRKNLLDKLNKRVRGEDTERDISTKQQPGKLG